MAGRVRTSSSWVSESPSAKTKNKYALVVIWLLCAYTAYKGCHVLNIETLSLLGGAPSCCGKCKKAAETLAYKQSFGYFDNIDDEDWIRRQERARNHRHGPSDPKSIAESKRSGGHFYLHNYFPLFTCPNQMRVGGGGDGPKWVCDPHQLGRIAEERGGCLIYSIGSRGQYEFEDGLTSLNGPVCEIHIFDPSADYSRPGDPKKNNIHYHRWGLSSSYSSVEQKQQKGWEYMTLQETMEHLGHTNRTIDIFKVDCEDCEWTTYKDWISPDVDIRQVCVETHYLGDGFFRYGVKTSDFFDDLQRAGFAMFSKELNFYSRGDVLEWSFIKLSKEFFDSDPAEAPFPEWGLN